MNTAQNSPAPDANRACADHPAGHPVHGRHAAVYLRQDQDSVSRPTIALEAAFRVGGRAAWDEKLVIQLTKHELIGLAAVLLGLQEECEYAGRGGSGKGFSVKRQSGSLFIRLWQGPGRQYQVQAEPSDVAHWAQLVLGQLGRRNGADGTMVLASLRACAALRSS